MKKLKLHQYNVISRFCEDIAKALMVAVILGQIAIANLLFRGLISAFILFSSFSMLFFAVYFSKETK